MRAEHERSIRALKDQSKVWIDVSSCQLCIWPARRLPPSERPGRTTAPFVCVADAPTAQFGPAAPHKANSNTVGSESRL